MHIRAAAILVVTSGLVLTLALPVSASSGDLDPSFGSGGAATLPMQTFSGHSVALQSDGKIVAVGAVRGADGMFHLEVARLTADGQLDASYGTAGSVTVPSVAPPAGVVVDTHDRAVVVARAVSTGDNVLGDDVVALVRLLPDGSLDPSFGAGGVAMPPSQFGMPAVDPSGIADQVVGGQDRPVIVGSLAGMTDFAAQRFNDDGTVDTSFGAGGVAVAHLPGSSRAHAVAVQPDGKLVLSGYVSGFSLALVRLLPDGALDPTFGAGGCVIDAAHSSDSPTVPGADVVIDPDGSITAVAEAVTAQTNDEDFAVQRYLSDGSPDARFGAAGRVVADMGGFDYVMGLAVRPDGRLIAVGTTVGRTTFTQQVAIARFLTTGDLDPSFGHEGRVVNGFPGQVSTYASAAVLQGSAVVTAVWPQLVARYGG